MEKKIGTTKLHWGNISNHIDLQLYKLPSSLLRMHFKCFDASFKCCVKSNWICFSFCFPTKSVKILQELKIQNKQHKYVLWPGEIQPPKIYKIVCNFCKRMQVVTSPTNHNILVSKLSIEEGGSQQTQNSIEQNNVLYIWW